MRYATKEQRLAWGKKMRELREKKRDDRQFDCSNCGNKYKKSEAIDDFGRFCCPKCLTANG